MEKEIWKPIKNYEGLYEVSNCGNVKSLSKKVKVGIKNNEFAIRKERILKQALHRCGYKRVTLSNNKNDKNYYVHRLVAEAFIENPNNYKYVNHKDENKQNNNVNNLEWCSFEYNINYGTRTKRASKNMRGKHNKPVYQYDYEGNFIRKWDSFTEIERKLGYNASNICACCKGKYKGMYNHIWKYAEILKGGKE